MSSLSSCPSGGYRVLEINLQLSYNEDKANKVPEKLYANLWLDQERKVKSLLDSSKKGLKNNEWKQRFVFSVSENFLRNENSSNVITYEIYQESKIFRDKLLGLGKCDLNSFFKTDCDDKESEKKAVYDEYPVYDSESSNDEDDKIREVKEGGDGLPELKGSISVELSKGSSSSGSSKGTLIFEAVVWKGCIRAIGGVKWKEVATTYDDFMGIQPRNTKSKGNKIFMCFSDNH